VEGSLGGVSFDKLFDTFCTDARSSGLPLLRGQLGMRILHPLVESVDLVWWREKQIESNVRAYSDSPQGWLDSPTYWMLTENVMELRRRLTTDSPQRLQFPIFNEFVAHGATDYFAQLTPFDESDAAVESQDGMMVSWVSDAPDGFSQENIDTLKRFQPYLGIVAKLYKRESTVHNIAAAYLGNDAGKRVLAGQIRLGEFEKIPSVIWYSDLRRSTAMAEELSPEDFSTVLNAYFDCTAGAVLKHHGEVLRFIGDAVLAVFPVSSEQSLSTAAENAIRASMESRRKLAVVNARRLPSMPVTIDFGVGLHVGELMYGNIGLPSRLEFSVIGPVANEVSRLEDLTKETGTPILVSGKFAEVLDLSWRDFGVREARGVRDGLHALAPPVEIPGF
jgi:adenylate cyclase